MSDRENVKPVTERSKGILFGVLLFIYTIFNLYLLELMTALGEENPEGIGALLMASLFTVVANLIMTLAVWQWKKWGVIGLCVFCVIGAIAFYFLPYDFHWYLIEVAFLSILLIFIFFKWSMFE